MTSLIKLPNLSRRMMMMGAGATLATGLTGARAYADGGRDPNSPSDNTLGDSIEIEDKPAQKPPKKIRVMLTQAKYPRISQKGLQTALKGIAAGHEYWIEGFSKKMSKNIFEMTLLDRKSTLKLLKNMATLKKPGKRRSFLRDTKSAIDAKIEYIAERIEDEEGSPVSLFFSKNLKLKKLKKDLDKCRAYEKLLDLWLKNPREGRLHIK